MTTTATTETLSPACHEVLALLDTAAIGMLAMGHTGCADQTYDEALRTLGPAVDALSHDDRCAVVRHLTTRMLSAGQAAGEITVASGT